MHFILSGDDSAIKLIGSLIVLGSMGIVTGYRAFRAKRNVEDTACSKVVSAPQGLVELQGQAWPTATLRSVDGRLLSYWHLQVQKYQRRGKSSGWVTVYNFQSSDPIILTDGSASCLIVPEKAEVIAIESTYQMHKISQEQRDQLTRSLPEAAEYFSLAGQIFGGFFGGNVRVLEKKIMAGAPMYARGEFSTMSGSLSKAVGDYEGYLGQYAKIDAPGFQARMFDSNHDGKISEVELINGYSFTANSFAHKPGIQTVSTSGFMFWSQQHNLIIADTHQKYLVNRLGTKTYLTLVDNG